MAIIMGKGCIEAMYGLIGWKGLKMSLIVQNIFEPDKNIVFHQRLGTNWSHTAQHYT